MKGYCIVQVDIILRLSIAAMPQKSAFQIHPDLKIAVNEMKEGLKMEPTSKKYDIP